MGTAAGFHADDTRRQLSKALHELGAADGLPQDGLAMRIHSMQTEYILGQVNSNAGNIHDGFSFSFD